MRDERVKKMTVTGVLAALVFVATYFFHVPTGFNGGYIHFGDALVYLSASILPLPYAMAASAIGAGLADILSPGSAIWAPATIIIKSLCCLPFTCRREKLLCGRNVLGVLIAGMITVIGYFLAGGIIGGFGAAIASLVFDWVQPVGSGICYILLAALLDRVQLKRTLPEAMGGIRK